ncbi:MAG: asparagine--tRNA ligase [Phaeodactylibacter xiamenensis]|uniref:Asparagine--tRNA ligase n=1 Tax=Phaeodactylibacter xiamenensis TaxID=1524460 RepID=A0A098S4C8_9BACT|nr:asparagine--tRNA ligase [Phaeodactylibacter xiamenensis]KGE87214.1 asparaginyl-tRNA synthetase [Phaeodactylibacter xiamenensis]MCR9052259.1 asparagine--tRNA ligase [bacterium]
MSKRTEIQTILEDFKPRVGQELTVMGWVRAFRSNRFIALNDGTSMGTLQVVVDFEQIPEDVLKQISFHACIKATGKLVESQGAGQDVELLADTVEILGAANPEEYPMQPKVQSLEFLREKAHFRMRTNTFSAVFRIRHGIAYAVHKYYNDNGYFYMHTPIITGSDAEGAGEMFRVTNLDISNPPRTEEGEVDFKEDFFEKPTNLTVSGQLQAEIGALALGKVYTFGPTFRAENSNTSRHLAEFWMIEPEVAFYDIFDNMDLAEDFCKYLINHILENYSAELEFLDQRIQNLEKNMPKNERRAMGLIETLRFVVDNDFERITYTDAVNILRNSKPYKKGKFEYDVEWGKDLQAEHERYLVEKKFQKPVIVRDYPASIKAFYMRMNDEQEGVPGKTVAAMDVLFPGIGEVIGGSQREERLDVLKTRMADMNVHEEELWWYLELRKFGGAPHAGFGLGFERMVQFITGMGNIRDVIAFPRTPGNAEF